MIEKNELHTVLNDWNYWDKTPPFSIPRNILNKPVRLLPDLALVIQGVRRCGKSTLMTQIMSRLGLDPADCVFVNFEDPRLSDHLDYHLLDEVISISESRRPGGKLCFFLDEVQNVAHWQKWLHSRLERPGRHCFAVTGSNASLLSGDFATALTGRHITIELFPFEFSEYQAAKPHGSITGYLNDGGFPRVLVYPEPEVLLREYFTDIIERDVRRHVAVRSTLILTQLVKAVFESAASEISQRNLAKMLGITPDTVKTYLDACEAAYILLPCPYFTFSERQRSARNKKYYPIDLGLRKAIITRGGGDFGKDLETAVFHHLRKKYGRVFYWRQKGEIDFVVQEGRRILPFQVSWSGEQERHRQAAREFRQAYPQADSLTFVTAETLENFLEG